MITRKSQISYLLPMLSYITISTLRATRNIFPEIFRIEVDKMGFPNGENPTEKLKLEKYR